MSPDHSSAHAGFTAATTAGAAMVLLLKLRQVLITTAVMAFSPPTSWGQH